MPKPQIFIGKLLKAICLFTLVLAMVAASTPSAIGFPDDEDHENEYEIKAAFIYNFAKFVEWPAGAFERPDSPYVIGIVGKDPFGPIMDRLAQGKSWKGRTFVIKRLKWDQPLRSCHILFVAASEKEHFSQLAVALKNGPVLTVGEAPGFANQYGIMNFYMDQAKIRFECNNEAAQRANLTISSRLLKIAKIIAAQ